MFNHRKYYTKASKRKANAKLRMTYLYIPLGCIIASMFSAWLGIIIATALS